MEEKEYYMSLALKEARKGMGWASPNPMVGAIIVKNGKIIGRGYHAKYGEKHAERNAILSCSEDPRGGDLYVTLEPCSHFGKQPPCTDAVIEAGIKRVFVGSKDPNPLVDGHGFEILRTHGIYVEDGILEEECRSLNSHFFHYIRHKRPYISLKYAMTLDGKSATESGLSKWITGPDARESVELLRHEHMAIMVGVNTVLKDDPMLTCHERKGLRNPVRIIADTNLRIPLESRIVESAGTYTTYIATSSRDEGKIKALEDKGCKVLVVENRNGFLDIPQLVQKIGGMNIDSILVESGGTLSWTLVEENLVDHVYAYIAPILLGGKNSLTPLMGKGFLSLQQAVRLKNVFFKKYGSDYLIEGDIEDVHGAD